MRDNLCIDKCINGWVAFSIVVVIAAYVAIEKKHFAKKACCAFSLLSFTIISYNKDVHIEQLPRNLHLNNLIGKLCLVVASLYFKKLFEFYDSKLGEAAHTIKLTLAWTAQLYAFISFSDQNTQFEASSSLCWPFM